MKKIYKLMVACLMGLTLTNCNDFLDYNPTAVIDEDKAFSEPEKMVNAAYAMLGDCWFSYPFNLFPYGDITSDDCLKGGSLRVKWMNYGIDSIVPCLVATAHWCLWREMELPN